MRLIRRFRGKVMREYLIDDEGDEVQVQFLEDGVQIGGACFPDDGSGEAFDVALMVAQGWGKSAAKIVH